MAVYRHVLWGDPACVCRCGGQRWTPRAFPVTHHLLYWFLRWSLSLNLVLSCLAELTGSSLLLTLFQQASVTISHFDISAGDQSQPGQAFFQRSHRPMALIILLNKVSLITLSIILILFKLVAYNMWDKSAMQSRDSTWCTHESTPDHQRVTPWTVTLC